jgi:hypothetical protein
VEDVTVENSNSILITLSSSTIPFVNVKGDNLSKMIKDSKALQAKENLGDKAKHIASRNINSLSKINQ